MDVSVAIDKITELSDTVNEYVAEIEKIKTKGVDKVNGLLEDLENTINDAVNKNPQQVETESKKTSKEIEETLSGIIDKIEKLLDDVKKWYNNQLTQIKRSVIKGTFCKLGVECSDEQADGMASIIPNPPIESMLPEINLSLQLPDLTTLTNIAAGGNRITLPRLEI